MCEQNRFGLTLTLRREPRGGTGEKPPRTATAAGPANSATVHDSRVGGRPMLGSSLIWLGVRSFIDQHHAVTCLVLLHLLERGVYLRHGHEFNHGLDAMLLRE